MRALALFLMLVAVNGFSPLALSRTTPLKQKKHQSVLRVTEDKETIPTEEKIEMEIPSSPEEVVRGIRVPSSRSSIGRSVDQDGKSNIWAVEPRMRAEEDANPADEKKKIIIVGLVVIGILLVVAELPQLNALFPDPSEY
jgi:hypothetical protein